MTDVEKSGLSKVLGALSLVGLMALSACFGFMMSHQRGLSEAESDWNKRQQTTLDFEKSTDTLRILPLINWHSAKPELRTEMGVSYLIETSDQRILFDLGHNPKQENPSPLQHNMQKLGIELDSIGMVFISHNHFDHVGGKQWSRENTFAPGIEQTPLPDMKTFTPITMTYPGQSPVASQQPQILEGAIATTGTIRRQLFMGRIDEQALVINVRNKGLVIVVGCGHQRLEKIITRVKELFDEPIYGVVGDLHMPVPQGRLNLLGINAQRFFASGNGPWDLIDMDDVRSNIDLLKKLKPGLLAIGGHDSSDQVIAMAKDEFKEVYQHVRVGQWISINN